MVYIIGGMVYTLKCGIYHGSTFQMSVPRPSHGVLCFLLRRAESDAGHHAAAAPVSAPHGPGLAAYS